MKTIVRKTRTPIMLALAGMIASLTTFVSSGTAVAAESIPVLQWPAVKVSGTPFTATASSSGALNLSCAGQDSAGSNYSNLRTYSTSGQLTRDLPRTVKIDGVENCISWKPAVDKNGDLYGTPEGLKNNGSYGYGPNLLAYSGTTLKWKYPTGCSSSPASATVGADGNIYFVNGSGKLVGLTPNVEPGMTQPKKVLDVPAISGCSEYVQALKNSIAVVKNMNVTFFSYGGVNLGGPASSAYIHHNVDQLNADGRFFYSTYIQSGSLRSTSISAYDYGQKKVAWTTTSSADGAYVYSADPYATPDGGTLVYLREKEMVGGSWTGYEAYNLVKLNQFGIKVWSKPLPRTNTTGTFGGADIRVDVGGNIAVVRNGELATNDPNNGTVEAVSVAVFDRNGNAIYDQLLRGNLDKNAGSVTGYTMEWNLGIAPNTLYVTAQQCGSNCYGETKLFPIKVTGLSLDYPRSAVLNATPRPAASYIALGDSFSSGEGVEPFEAGTSTPNLNTCHRSNYAYARLISGTSLKIPSLGSNGFRACSGAVTQNITDAPQWNEGTQLDLWPDSMTQLVTLTIGGNDIGFADLAKACVNPLSSCAINSTAYNTALNKINNELPGKLSATYKSILKYAPNAKVYVLGYPHVIANKTASDGPDARCAYMQDGGTNWAEAQGVRSIVTKLNEKIATAITTENSSRLRFVDMNGTNSPFRGHEICSTSTSYFQNLNQAGTNEAYVFHPNAAGQQAYATLAANAINAS